KTLDFCFAVESQRDLDFVFGQWRRLDADIDPDRWLLRVGRERAGRVRVLEREILHVLHHDADLWNRHLRVTRLRRRAAIRDRHRCLRTASRLWLTCGAGANNGGMPRPSGVPAATRRPAPLRQVAALLARRWRSSNVVRRLATLTRPAT